MRWRNLAIVALVTLPMVMAGCSDHGLDPVGDGSGGDPGPAPVSFAAEVQPIFAASCLNCHGVGGNAGLDLTPEVAWANLVGVQATNYAPRLLVMSGSPESSVLFLKLSGDTSTGSRMPLGGSLGRDTIELVRQWILEGALDN